MKFMKNTSGQSLVEVALVLPLFLIIIMGIFQFGALLSTQLWMQELARDAVRNGSVGYSNEEIVSLVTSRAMWLDPNKIVVTVSPSEYTQRHKGDSLEVDIAYDMDIIVPFMNVLLGSTYHLDSHAEMRVE